jgi:hypothetical protein
MKFSPLIVELLEFILRSSYNFDVKNLHLCLNRLGPIWGSRDDNHANMEMPMY